MGTAARAATHRRWLPAHARTPHPRKGQPAQRQQLDRLVSQIEADIDRYINKTRALEAKLTKAWERFTQRQRALLSLMRRRPGLQQIDPWLLDEQQLALVEHDSSGAMVLHGTSGSGKTVVLLHRALREARRSPTAKVLVLARHDTLVRRLREAAAALSGGRVPPNLAIRSVYDVWATIVHDVIGEAGRHRLRDGTATVLTERTSPTESVEDLNSWLQFVRHTPTSVFKQDPDVRWLRQDLSHRLPIVKRDPYLAVDHYLYQEVAYIRSAFPRSALPAAYLEMDRQGRTLPLGERHRRACLRILEAWEAWLRQGYVNDVIGVTWRAADAVLDDRMWQRCRLAVGADHILVDELQDLSTLDLRMIRRIGALSEGGPNAFYLVGDLEQKGSYLHLDLRAAGFNIRGRVRSIRRNYRNTREILAAAYSVLSDPDIQRDLRRHPDLQILDPELSASSGAMPMVLPCRGVADQVALILCLVRDRCTGTPPPTLAVVSESLDTLDHVEAGLSRLGLSVERIWSIDDLDKRTAQTDAAARTDVVCLGGFDAVRGVEFDTLILADLSEESLPRPYVEVWRNAARLYSVLTRARSELLITLVGQPSPYLESMRKHVEWLGPLIIEDDISRVLGRLRRVAQR